MTHPTLLVIDDEPALLQLVARQGARAGFQVITAEGGRPGIAKLADRRVDLVIVDLQMPDLGGLDVLRHIREEAPGCQAVLMTGDATVDTAVEAVKLGAMDYLNKPLDLVRLQSLLESVRQELDRRRRVFEIESDLARRLEFRGMIGRSAVMQEVFTRLRRLAPHARTALITGETGTGKELAARALHDLGPRQRCRFVTINCSAVVETLVESEVFGHVRGAFTGAASDKAGLFETASGGTLFLDEVGELPLTLQAKLLRVLEAGEVQRVGAIEARRVDVHVIAASSRDLRADVAAGRFRSDLFYRLNVVEVTLPALRERREDIPYLTAAFMRAFAERAKRPIDGMTTGAERLLQSAPWHGNVRELRTVVERACMLSDGGQVTERELRMALPRETPARAMPDDATLTPAWAPLAGADSWRPAPDGAPLATLSRLERDHVLRALARARGNKKAAAAMLGVSRRALYRRLERLALGNTIARRPTGGSDGEGKGQRAEGRGDARDKGEGTKEPGAQPHAIRAAL